MFLTTVLSSGNAILGADLVQNVLTSLPFNDIL